MSSLSKLGPFGAGLEIVIILYMLVASTVGLYSLPVVSTYRPHIKQTPLTHIVGNCTLLLILSSALPLLSRILGKFYNLLYKILLYNINELFY